MGGEGGGGGDVREGRKSLRRLGKGGWGVRGGGGVKRVGMNGVYEGFFVLV